MSDKAEQKRFGTPDETRTFSGAPLTCCGSAAREVGRLVLQPGWRWSNDVKPLAETESCAKRRTSSTT